MNQVQNQDPRSFVTKLPKVKINIGRYDYVIDRCKGKNILHLGCVDDSLLIRRIRLGTLLHQRIEKVAKLAWGLDSSQDGVKLLQQSVQGKILHGSVEELDKIPALQQQHFEVIVATELIEHVNNVGQFLTSAKVLFSDNTTMVLTTPNAFKLNAIPYLLRRYEPVHPDHNYWFSHTTLRTILNKHGYEVIEEAVYSYGIFNWRSFVNELLGLAWRAVGKHRSAYTEDEGTKSVTHSIIDIFGFPIRAFLYTLNPFFSEGLIMVIKPKPTPRPTNKKPRNEKTRRHVVASGL